MSLLAAGVGGAFSTPSRVSACVQVGIRFLKQIKVEDIDDVIAPDDERSGTQLWAPHPPRSRPSRLALTGRSLVAGPISTSCWCWARNR